MVFRFGNKWGLRWKIISNTSRLSSFCGWVLRSPVHWNTLEMFIHLIHPKCVPIIFKRVFRMRACLKNTIHKACAWHWLCLFNQTYWEKIVDIPKPTSPKESLDAWRPLVLRVSIQILARFSVVYCSTTESFSIFCTVHLQPLFECVEKPTWLIK